MNIARVKIPPQTGESGVIATNKLDYLTMISDSDNMIATELGLETFSFSLNNHLYLKRFTLVIKNTCNPYDSSTMEAKIFQIQKPVNEDNMCLHIEEIKKFTDVLTLSIGQMMGQGF